jgi:hypothetical protein
VCKPQEVFERNAEWMVMPMGPSPVANSLRCSKELLDQDEGMLDESSVELEAELD